MTPISIRGSPISISPIFGMGSMSPKAPPHHIWRLRRAFRSTGLFSRVGSPCTISGKTLRSSFRPQFVWVLFSGSGPDSVGSPPGAPDTATTISPHWRCGAHRRLRRLFSRTDRTISFRIITEAFPLQNSCERAGWTACGRIKTGAAAMGFHAGYPLRRDAVQIPCQPGGQWGLRDWQ